MKPVLFKSPEELSSFLEICPRLEGVAIVNGQEMDCDEILNKCGELIPKIFQYREVLAKGQGGLGSNKAVRRFIDAAVDNVAIEKMQEYDEALADIEKEVESLFSIGAVELSSQLKETRTKVAKFENGRGAIEAFKGKLQKCMKRVQDRYGEVSTELNQKREALKKALDETMMDLVIREIEDKHQSVADLISAMDFYCNLQIGYLGLCIAAV